MALYLGGKFNVGTNHLSPRRQLNMSSNDKYIGLDIHKEAISIAVLNGAGRLVMESIIETKAATLVQFLQGLRGELHVTLEEGTWAAWLYDVLRPRVQERHRASEARTEHFLLRNSLMDLWTCTVLV
jgi:hypothetical protein